MTLKTSGRPERVVQDERTVQNVSSFSITQGDLDRAITDFTHRLIYDNIESDVKKVLESLVPIEAEVKTRDDRWLMMRMRPYRTVENVISGVVRWRFVWE